MWKWIQVKQLRSNSTIIMICSCRVYWNETCLYVLVYIVVRNVTSKRSCVLRWNRVSTTACAPTSIRARTGAIAPLDILDQRVTKVRIDRGWQIFIFVFLTWTFFAEVVLDITANFSGNSYLQLENSLLDRNKREHSLSMTFTTDSANGLLYWQGQEPNNDGVVDNYIAVSSEKITINCI